MKLCFEYKGVKLEQDEEGKFKVSLGPHSNSNLGYEHAAYDLGEAIMHILEANGDLIDDEDIDE